MYYGERFNAWTHLVGAVLAMIGSIGLVVLASLDGSPWKLTAVSVYGSTLVLLFIISTLYHSVRGRAKSIMRKLDHLSIYLVIAGTYTPFCLITLKGIWGWSLFGMVWGMALVGMLQEIRPRSEARELSLAIYGVMGWMLLIAADPLLDAIGAAGFSWLVSGGLLYTIGIVFFVFDERFRHWHGIWHLFVLAGSFVHFLVIWRYVI